MSPNGIYGILVLLYVSGHVQVSNCEEIFRSIARLRLLVNVEHELVTALHNYINESRNLFRTGDAPSSYPKITGRTINALERRLLDTRDTINNATGYIDLQVTHPIQAFQLLKRYTKFWILLKLDIDPYVGKGITSILDRNNNILPNITDFLGACGAITRLQSTYQISVRDAAKGNLPGEKHVHASMSVDDCYFIGEVAYTNNDDHYCVAWMEEALRMYREGYPIRPWEHATEILLVEFMAYCYHRAGYHHKAYKYTVDLLTLDPNNAHGLLNIPVFKEKLENSTITADEELLYPVRNSQFDHYHRCCRGEASQLHILQPKKMVCRYLSHNPLLRLKGIGEEVINTDPKIVMFRDVLSDREVEIMKGLAFPKLVISQTVGSGNGSEIIPNRVSNTAWLSDVDYNDTILPVITRRLEMVTGLSANSAEPYQVLNYGIGGHYTPHLDAATDSPHAAINERIATLLIYLTDVEYGGGTVFVDHGVRASPRKGDATFWYNLRKSGELDSSTTHGGCPVLLGEKWIINKWFNYYGQFSNRRCGLSPGE
ncbi:prolyl 4-hydroxylase subunit alpha-1-like [Glandiceps talaboti]